MGENNLRGHPIQRLGHALAAFRQRLQFLGFKWRYGHFFIYDF